MTTSILLKDYTPPPYWVDNVHVDICFLADEARVTVCQRLRRNAVVSADVPLILQGESLETLSILLDGHALSETAYRLGESSLVIPALPEACELTIVTRIRPDANTALSGLYRSADGYFSQCEAEGFRRITWFQDRPDVMARYTVTLHADQKRLPVLLANGNPMAAGEEEGGRHWATWEDPFPKPCYLFAVVAARLDVLRDTYRTASGREVQLAIYVSPGKLDQCGHAMAALKKAMRWDEERFGLACDLDHYMIVAVGDFNMGAMENKGLNIFNTKYVLARPDVATDLDFENIDRVVAHEYFHNWTGNRVTCRDWFQLSLKEGLTVFRDQEFGADVHHQDIARIREVRGLRAAQFPEDAGPMAHPVRPASYVEINNFYTATVYEKGAEVVRMIQTLIGKEAFRRGMDLYFQRHDGQAVTCEDFVAAMSDASGRDFTQFMRWYVQAGTPQVAVQGRHDAATGRYTLHCRQLPPSGQPDNLPYHIPLAVGFIGQDGSALTATQVLSLTEPEQVFVFEGLSEAPVPSLLRNFSAPVLLDYPYSEADLTHLLAHDKDPFNRWEAGQRLAGRLILAGAEAIAAGLEPVWPESFALACARVLQESDPAFAAEALTLPSEATLAEQMALVDPDALHAARRGLARFLSLRLAQVLLATYERLTPTEVFRPDATQAGRRALRNLCLAYLLENGTASSKTLALAQFHKADNMTEQFGALAALCQYSGPERDQVLADFYHRWQGEALVVDKWLQVQATSRVAETLIQVQSLTRHPAFDLRNPNKVYALLRAFGANHVRFHAADGAGYRFMAEQILQLDPLNPQVASRLARCFDRWKKFDKGRQAYARVALGTIHAQAGLSADVAEVVGRALV